MQNTIDIRPLREADGALTVLDRLVEVAPDGVNDIIEALRRGMPLYESNGVYLGSLGDVMTARRLKELENEPLKAAG